MCDWTWFWHDNVWDYDRFLILFLNEICSIWFVFISCCVISLLFVLFYLFFVFSVRCCFARLWQRTSDTELQARKTSCVLLNVKTNRFVSNCLICDVDLYLAKNTNRKEVVLMIDLDLVLLTNKKQNLSIRCFWRRCARSRAARELRRVHTETASRLGWFLSDRQSCFVLFCCVVLNNLVLCCFVVWF